MCPGRRLRSLPRTRAQSSLQLAVPASPPAPFRCLLVQALHDLLPDEPWLAKDVFAKGKGVVTTYFLDWNAEGLPAGELAPPSAVME